MSKSIFKSEKLVALQPDLDKMAGVVKVEGNSVSEEKDGAAFWAVTGDKVTAEQIEAVDASRSHFIRVQGAFMEQTLVEAVKKDKSVERVNGRFGLHGAGNVVETTALRSRTSTVNFAKEGEPTETTKYGVVSMKVTTASRGLKSFRDLLSTDAEEYLK